MIHFFVPRDQAWIITNLRDRLSADAASRISVHSYLSVGSPIQLEPGPVIFTGLEVLTPIQRKIALAIWTGLEKLGTSFHLMNHPLQSLGRYDLLKTLSEKGMNHFRAYRIHELHKARLRYPVFVREEFKHTGSLTELLHSASSLSEALEDLTSRGFKGDHLLVVEFMDTSGHDGLYKKYSVQRMGDAIIPRYLTMDRHWVVKENTPAELEEQLYSENQVEDEIRFMKENPHEEKLRKIFRLAGIEFGRIDYSINTHNGEVETWEINTLPTFGSAPGTSVNLKRKTRSESKKLFYSWMSEALIRNDSDPNGQPLELKIPSGLAAQIQREKWRQNAVSLLVNAGEKLPRIPGMRSFRTEVKRRIRSLKER